MPKEINLVKTARRFDANISALRVFNSQIGHFAEEHDKTTAAQHDNSFAEIVGISVEDLNSLGSIDKDGFRLALSAQSEQEQIEIYDKLKLTDKQKSIILKFNEVNHKEFLLKSLSFLRTSTKTLPIQAFILRRSALITLASHFEFLITELLHSYYLLYPQALPAEERVLSLADLKELGSIEDAENYLIEKEIDSLLRDTIDKQLDYFSSKRIKVNLEQLTTHRNRLVEIFQRRNLIVHNDGIVNKIYLSRVPKELLNEEMEIGKRLDVSEDYLNQAIETIYLSGVKLTQLCWRKWQKDSIETAESVYINLLYESLQEHQYDFIKALQDFSLTLDYTSDRNKRVAIINHAIALRELNQPDDLNKLLGVLDWSSCSLEFRAALFAIKGEKENLFRILPKAIAAKEIQKFHLEEWPLFEPFRKNEEFLLLIQDSTNDDILFGNRA